MTLLSPIVPYGRLARAALGLLVCALSLLAVVGGPACARAAPAIVSATVMGSAHDADRGTEPRLHADGAALDLDDVSTDGRSAAITAAALDLPPIMLGRRHADDGRPGEVDVPLPERPPRA